MARPTLYSRSTKRPAAAEPGRGSAATSAPVANPTIAGAGPGAESPPRVKPEAGLWLRARTRLVRHERWWWATGALLLALVAGWPAWRLKLPQPFSLEQIDAAMRESIAKEPLASAQAAAYEAVLPSVVRVVGRQDQAGQPGASGGQGKSGQAGEADDNEEGPRGGRSVGTGVVIVNTGLILTNLHVVQEAERITVTFADGSESEAVVVNRQPSNDLAVLQAKTIPDDLQAATMRSTGGLSPGDGVVAVGFPFGIGPSASAGVISGLKREFRSPQGQRVLTNLIQFDAAANPGNSGGPLVTLDGHVVGIVTAIMNPEGHSTFIGIGFAVPIENAASAAGMPPF